MKTLLKLAVASSLMLAASSSYAWFGNDSGWGNGYNPYDEWDPRYWMEEMEDFMDDDDDYYGGYGYGPGPYGPPQGYYGPPPGYYGPQSYGPPPGYRGPQGYNAPPPGYNQRPNNVPPQGYAPRGPAPQN